jgi:hexosaminidase
MQMVGPSDTLLFHYLFILEPPSGQLRLTEPDVIEFTKKLFKAAIKHTPGKYFSTGGDEINQRCYNEDPVVQASLASSGKTFQEALAAFTNETHETLVENDKTPVVWQEMVLSHGNLDLSPETVVLYVTNFIHSNSFLRRERTY